MAYTVVLTQATTLTFNSVAVAGVVGMKGLGSGKSTEIDITTLASTAKEFRQGLQDFGSITVTLIRSLDDAGQAALLTAHAAQASQTCIIVLPSGTLKTATFTAFVDMITSDIDKDGVVTGEAVLRISGPVVWS
jgi:hypothetical protein